MRTFAGKVLEDELWAGVPKCWSTFGRSVDVEGSVGTLTVRVGVAPSDQAAQQLRVFEADRVLVACDSRIGSLLVLLQCLQWLCRELWKMSNPCLQSYTVSI